MSNDCAVAIVKGVGHSVAVVRVGCGERAADDLARSGVFQHAKGWGRVGIKRRRFVNVVDFDGDVNAVVVHRVGIAVDVLAVPDEHGRRGRCPWPRGPGRSFVLIWPVEESMLKDDASVTLEGVCECVIFRVSWPRSHSQHPRLLRSVFVHSKKWAGDHPTSAPCFQQTPQWPRRLRARNPLGCSFHYRR